MGHRVPNHKSKCRNLHGHRYSIEVGVDDILISAPGSSDEGMVMDFGDLKGVMMDVLDGGFDHGFVMYEGDVYADTFRSWMENDLCKVIVVPFIPTAENLAKYWFELLDKKLSARDINLQHVKVWETPTSTALYTRE